MNILLREFLYLDYKLTQEFLAQVEGGVFSEEAQRRLEQKGKDVGGEASVGALGQKAGIRGGRRAGREEETERTVQQTPESAVARLIQGLNERKALQWLEAVDQAIWDQLRRGEMIEADATIAVSTMKRYMAIAQEAGPLIEFMEAFGEEGLDDESRQAMELLTVIGQIMGDLVPIVAALSGSPDYKLIASLRPDSLRTDVDQLDGDATVLAKIQRVLGPNERHTMLDLIPGVRGFTPSQRREMEEGMENTPDLPDMIIEPPAARVTVVAIYR